MHRSVAEAKEGTVIPLNGDVLRSIAPHFNGSAAARQAQIIAELDPVLEPTLQNYEIATRLRIAHFLAHTCHESAGYRTTEEFASGDQYEGRQDLGNTEPGDGRRYKGRGLLQLTGRANYRNFGAALGVDLEGDPSLAAHPPLALRIACEYWHRRDLNADADRDDLVATRRRVGGGLNGLAGLREYLAKAKAALARIEATQVADGNPGALPVLARGSTGETVGTLQTSLRTLGFDVTIDNCFGAATELAVMEFQHDQTLDTDGIVGPLTWKALDKALP